jgi:tRNA threonylcarbamoyladenosine biosynthesis protein TsaB
VLILGISTSTRQAGCAIGGHEGVLAMVQSARGKRHAETLAPSIDVLRHHAQVDLDEIGCIAVDVGPGLFTGLRVGIATAKAMAHALRVPMIGIASLDLVAFPVRWTHRLVVAAIDARRGELFMARYKQVPGGIQRLDDYVVCSPDDLASELLATPDDILMVGDGALRYQERFQGIVRVEMADQGLAYPSAASLVQLAHPKALREEFVYPSELSPIYMRPPDAAIGWASRDDVSPRRASAPPSESSSQVVPPDGNSIGSR